MLGIIAQRDEKREGFVPVLKSASFIVAVSLFVATAGEGAAFGQSGICSGANTCSEAFFQCVATRCPAAQSASCTAACKLQFDDCRRTGAFGGSADCRGKTLMRK